MSVRPSAFLLPLLLLLLLQSWPTRADDSEATWPGHLEAFGRQGPNLRVDQVDGFLPPKEFVDNYLTQNRPLLFKGAAKQSPAFSKWTDEYLSGATPPRPLGDIFIEHSKKENRSQKYNFVHFKEFLEIYNTSNVYMVSEMPEFMLQDLILPFPLQCKYFIQGGLDTNVVWFSSGGTSSVIHHDSYENINCLYRGRKSLVLVNTTRYKEQVDKIIDKDDGAYSTADVDKIDMAARPEFRDLEFHVAEMDTGDCLYIPLFWVHQVRSFDNNLAVNIWWPPKKIYPLGACLPKYSTIIHFGKVYFRTIEKNIRNDVDYASRVIDTNLPAEERTEAALLKMLSEGNSEVADNKEFAAAVSGLFKSLDFNMDGALSAEELKAVLTRKRYRPIYDAIGAYNVLVHQMHSTAPAPAPGADHRPLPKLLRTSNSDESVFAPERTWEAIEPPPLGDDELGDETMEAMEGLGGDLKGKKVDGGEKKDEL